MKYKFIADEKNESKHFIEGNPVKYGDEIEFTESSKAQIDNFIRHHYIEEIPEVKNEDSNK